MNDKAEEPKSKSRAKRLAVQRGAKAEEPLKSKLERYKKYAEFYTPEGEVGMTAPMLLALRLTEVCDLLLDRRIPSKDGGEEKPHRCPVCEGAGSVFDRFANSTGATRKCTACGGTGIVWRPKPTAQEDETIILPGTKELIENLKQGDIEARKDKRKWAVQEDEGDECPIREECEFYHIDLSTGECHGIHTHWTSCSTYFKYALAKAEAEVASLQRQLAEKENEANERAQQARDVLGPNTLKDITLRRAIQIMEKRLRWRQEDCVEKEKRIEELEERNKVLLDRLIKKGRALINSKDELAESEDKSLCISGECVYQKNYEEVQAKLKATEVKLEKEKIRNEAIGERNVSQSQRLSDVQLLNGELREKLAATKKVVAAARDVNQFSPRDLPTLNAALSDYDKEK